MNRSTCTRARLADAREVVAAEVDEHHVLGAILLGREQRLRVAVARRDRAGDRVHGGARALALDDGLRRAADERDVAELEQEEIRRRIDATECPVELERRGRGRALGALRDHDLEDVALADVLLRALDAPQMLVALREAAELAARAGTARRLRLRAVEEPRGLVGVADEDLGDAARVVEADEQLGHDEAALVEARAVRRAAAPSARAA